MRLMACPPSTARSTANSSDSASSFSRRTLRGSSSSTIRRLYFLAIVQRRSWGEEQAVQHTPLFAQHPFDRRQQIDKVIGLAHKIVGPEFLRLDCILEIGKTRQHNHFG